MGLPVLLFIFNFEDMIKKSFLVTFILLGIHALITNIGPPPASQYTLQENLVKAQAFIYSDQKENIIVGSSLSHRLVTDSLTGFYNLSFAGLGLFDGLEIILEHKKFPRQILIEMNVVQRGRSENFLSNINSPLLGPMRKYLPSLRDRYQPIGMVGETMVQSLKKNAAEKNDFTENDNIHFDKILELIIAENTAVPDKKMMKERFDALRSHVTLLEKNGVKVVFFEMPVNEKLCELARPRMIREYFHEYFLLSENNYIRMPDCSDYKTSDGVHLTNEEAKRYTDYLMTQLAKISVMEY